MSRSVPIQNLTGARALEAESDYDLRCAFRVLNAAGVDWGPQDLSLFDPGGFWAGNGFVGELRDSLGGTLLATALVTMAGGRSYGTLTFVTIAADGETVTIGNEVYTFKTTPAAAYDVLVGADAAACMANLIAAINGDGDAPPQYDEETAVHPHVVAVEYSTTSMRIEAKSGGVWGNYIATTETLAGASNAWGAALMAGGTGQAGFLVHFDGPDIPTTLVTTGISRRMVFDVFGLLADNSPIKVMHSSVQLHASSTDPTP